jgi:hypothetical protein
MAVRIVVVLSFCLTTYAAGGDKDEKPQKCLGMEEKVSMDGIEERRSGTEVMRQVMNNLKIALARSLKNDESFKSIIEGKTDCQWDCFPSVVGKLTTPVVWGTKLFALEKDRSKRYFARAITGAFTLCYPDADRDVVLNFTTQVVADMRHPHEVEVNLKFERTCPGHPVGGQKAVKEFSDYADYLGMAGQLVLLEERFAKLKAYITKEGFDCQQKCAFGKEGTLARSLMLLWNTGIFSESNGRSNSIESFTGAIKTCYPLVAHDLAHRYVEAVMDQVDAELEKVTRLYPSLRIPFLAAKQASENPARSYVALAFAAFSALLVGGALALRRVRQTAEDEFAAE